VREERTAEAEVVRREEERAGEEEAAKEEEAREEAAKEAREEAAKERAAEEEEERPRRRMRRIKVGFLSPHPFFIFFLCQRGPDLDSDINSASRGAPTSRGASDHNSDIDSARVVLNSDIDSASFTALWQAEEENAEGEDVALGAPRDLPVPPDTDVRIVRRDKGRSWVTISVPPLMFGIVGAALPRLWVGGGLRSRSTWPLAKFPGLVVGHVVAGCGFSAILAGRLRVTLVGDFFAAGRALRVGCGSHRCGSSFAGRLWVAGWRRGAHARGPAGGATAGPPDQQLPAAHQSKLLSARRWAAKPLRAGAQ